MLARINLPSFAVINAVNPVKSGRDRMGFAEVDVLMD